MSQRLWHNERVDMDNLRGKNILVLGGSGALGSLLTTKLATQGAQVMATTTSNDRGAQIPSVASPRLLLDLERPDSIEVLVNYLIQSGAQIDGIVNATGVVAFGPATELSATTLARLAAVNLTGPIAIISGLLPALKTSAAVGNEPFVVNISGVVAESPMAGLAAYSATKAGLWAFDQALTREVRKDGIRVIDARPGHTETGLATRAIAGTAPAFPTGMTPESVADRIVNAILNGESDLPSTAFAA
ncbi:MAG: SDR family NAD(P)-dependent oxidoreductase [Rhodoluna sp.]|nr:SDR family NAD(P)-dependent oxidoreductase [Rhodoluna sp.]